MHTVSYLPIAILILVLVELLAIKERLAVGRARA
jgi:hypothetical protein